MNTLTRDEWLEWMKDKFSVFAFCIPAYKSVDSDGNTEYTIDERHLRKWGGFDITNFIVQRMHEFTVDDMLFTPVVLRVSFDELATRSRDTRSAEASIATLPKRTNALKRGAKLSKRTKR